MKKITIKLQDKRQMNFILDETNAPLSVENFVTYVKEGFFKGLCFHRVISNFMIQGGGFVADGKGITPKKATHPQIKGEFFTNGVINNLKHEPGVISMARTYIPDSATSQFFICTADCSYLDGQYSAFGKVCDKESLQVAIDISNVATHSFNGYDDIPNSPIVIEDIILVEE